MCIEVGGLCVRCYVCVCYVIIDEVSMCLEVEILVVFSVVG